MKISPPIDAVAAELESWALEDGWKAVGLAIAEQYHAAGGGEILPEVNTGDGLRNAVQRVKRIFRGFNGPRYAELAEQLKSAALAALPTERRARIELPGDPVLLAALAAKGGIEAANSVHLHASLDVIEKEISEAINALIAMKNSVRATYGNLSSVSNFSQRVV